MLNFSLIPPLLYTHSFTRGWTNVAHLTEREREKKYSCHMRESVVAELNLGTRARAGNDMQKMCPKNVCVCISGFPRKLDTLT